MSMMRIQPAPFFASKNRAFWNLQLAGWGGAFLLRALNALANGLPYNLLVLIFVTTITGFSISLVLSVIYRQLIDRSPVVTWGGTAIALFVAVVLHAVIDAWVQELYYAASPETSFVQRFVGITYIPLTLLGGWSALYYAINFFLTVEEQADRLERLEAQATTAQLAMLRYQLNPHFLFNTLNSISTLVLLKQTEPANAMLTRLSGFLRHTLITEPGSQVTLAQEVETLQLYLDIERMRFEERLRTHFDIEEAAMDARLPSMLLQPLIENAVKYAVSPQEEGARISLSARVVGQRLRIAVEDTGPGADEPLQRSMLEYDSDGAARPATSATSTGVGLANIRNRLMQGYGENHLFETSSQPGGGFTVLIEIPYEPAELREPLPTRRRPAAGTAPPSSPPTEPEPPASPEEALDNVINLNPQRSIGNSQ
ncbi:sensor histidine kinase [Qipengyuania sp. ASV99]|uniref:sensor histidine kinase n=1 Tax=Qipengyuania sp. ASV99 TaxID=3399681 RepID=UPI003A4C6EEE